MLTSVLPYLRVWNLSSGIPRAGEDLPGAGSDRSLSRWLWRNGKAGVTNQCPTSDPKQHHHISGAIWRIQWAYRIQKMHRTNILKGHRCTVGLEALLRTHCSCSIAAHTGCSLPLNRHSTQMTTSRKLKNACVPSSRICGMTNLPVLI